MAQGSNAMTAKKKSEKILIKQSLKDFKKNYGK